MIKVVVNGSQGRMGREVVQAVESDPDLKLVGQTDLGDDLEEVIQETEAEVVVDFTVPAVRVDNFKKIINNGARAVVGTTGFTEAEIEELSKLCQGKKIGAVIAPNFAIGAVLLMKFAAEAAKYLGDAEIIELHHDKKQDYPSGTAVKTAQLMLKEREKFNQGVSDKVVNLEGARGAETGGLRIHSVRLPGLVAHQEVIFGALGQTLSIRHDSMSRESFMPGVIMAVKKVMESSELIYGLEHIL
ncbi:MAG: 4-hydroxy-tetrahydrodipicolinate reductase [Deltaproteobacteria bacterium]|nr:4-hydroxy-tetrahydrodipicolinate reductase [Deltaproteobacteria bacterium]